MSWELRGGVAAWDGAWALADGTRICGDVCHRGGLRKPRIRDQHPGMESAFRYRRVVCRFWRQLLLLQLSVRSLPATASERRLSRHLCRLARYSELECKEVHLVRRPGHTAA